MQARHKTAELSVVLDVNSPIQALADSGIQPAALDLETIFRDQYPRVARLIAGVVRDRARAEEIAVDVFLKLWRAPESRRANPEGWLHRAAVRAGIDELRRQARRQRYERKVALPATSPAPDQVYATSEQQKAVRLTLAAMRKRQAELLLMRSNGLSYSELAATLNLNPASVGTLLSRAQAAFRKEYLKRYDEQ